MLEWEVELSIYRVRFKILKHLDDHNNIHPFVSLEKAELLQELDITESDLDESIKFLEDKMLIETVFFMGGDYWTKISSNGIDEIYLAEKIPKKGTRFFPPVNLINGRN